MKPYFALLAATLLCSFRQEAPTVNLIQVQDRYPWVLKENGLSMVGDHLLVKVKPGTDVAALANRHAGAVRRSLGGDLHLLHVPVEQVRAGGLHPAIAGYSADADVVYAEPDYLMDLHGAPNDPRYSSQWGMDKIGAPAAWDLSTGSQTVRIAVLDTGADYNHADLAANIWTNPGEIPGNGIDDDGDGFIDDVHGYDFGDGDSDPMDPFGHGTNVTGIIGAVGNNSVGVAGVCWSVELVIVKIVTSSWGLTVSSAVQGVNYATARGARITSNSWGVGAFSQSLYDAIAAQTAAGALFVCAAGNSNVDLDAAPNYPQSYDLPGIICVGASTESDDKASFSSFGASTVDLAAPGTNILSTFPTGIYYSYSGTSQAAPHVAGACALVASKFPTLTAAQIRSRILSSATPLAAWSGLCVTGGRLNLPDALAGMDPTIQIVTPAADSSTTLADFAFDGAASDDGSIVSITWANAANGQTGAATGTTSWNVLIPLQVGDNVISITAVDNEGFTASASRTITRTVVGVPPAPPPPSEGSSGGKCGSIGLDLMLPLGLLWLVRRLRR